MFVVTESGMATCRTGQPSGAITLMQPVFRVATQIFPAASTARLSKRWNPPRPVTSRPPFGDGQPCAPGSCPDR
jgi:hypothetical protein